MHLGHLWPGHDHALRRLLPQIQPGRHHRRVLLLFFRGGQTVVDTALHRIAMGVKLCARDVLGAGQHPLADGGRFGPVKLELGGLGQHVETLHGTGHGHVDDVHLVEQRGVQLRLCEVVQGRVFHVGNPEQRGGQIRARRRIEHHRNVAFDLARLVVACNDEGHRKRQSFGLVHGHDLNRISATTGHNGPGVTHAVPRSQEAPQAALLGACDLKGHLHQGFGIGVKPPSHAQDVAHVTHPSDQRAVGVFQGTQIRIQVIHHRLGMEGFEALGLAVDLHLLPHHMRVQHFRFPNARGFQRGHALQPRCGMSVFVGIHHPSGQGHDRERGGMTPDMQAVLGLGSDSLVQHVLRDARALLVGAHEDGHVGPVEPATLVRGMVSQSRHQGVVQQGFPRVLVAILDGLNVDLSLEAAFGGLGLVVVDRLQTRWKAVLQSAKKRVVPRHNGLATAPVGLEHLVVQGVVKGPLRVGKRAFFVVHNARQIQQLAVVSVAPAVDGLLAVAHDEGSVALGQDVIHQRDQVLPLGH